MSFDSLLVHRGTVRRRVAGTDRFGDKLEEHVDYATNIPCRLTVSSLGGGFANLGGERLDETSTVVMEDRRVYFPPGVDVREDDTVTVVDPRTGATLVEDANLAFVRRIFDGQGNEHHVEVLFKVWRRGDT